MRLLLFYAPDLRTKKRKLFRFRVTSEADARRGLDRFGRAEGYYQDDTGKSVRISATSAKATTPWNDIFKKYNL